MSQPKPKAYAILAGGGVKGAALAGALMAAEEVGIEFIGYGGCSAGSIVALLASLGYTNEQIKSLVVETNFADFLDDSGILLKRLKGLIDQAVTFPGLLRAIIRAWRWKIWHQVKTRYGLYTGGALSRFVDEKIRERFPELRELQTINFGHLKRWGCKPLKVVASDIQGRAPVVYSVSNLDDQVSHAIRASVSFPFVFEPVELRGRQLVDGGLSTNLPIALFNEECGWSGVPVVAFDLQSAIDNNERVHNVRSFCGDLLATALEASDNFYRIFSNIHYIPIKIPEGVGTLDFFLTKMQRDQLWQTGRDQAYRMLHLIFRHLEKANNSIEAYQAALNVPPIYIESLLRALVAEVSNFTPAQEIRAYVFLRDESDDLLLSHYFNGQGAATPELKLEIASTWPICLAFRTKKPQAANLAEWLPGMPDLPQAARLLFGRRQSLFCVPLFKLGEEASLAESVETVPVMGVLAIDSATPLDGTQWIAVGKRELLFRIVSRWAGILARVLH